MNGRILMADIGRALRTAVTTGKVKFGLAASKKAIKNGTAKLLVISQNCPDDWLKSENLDIERVVYPGNNMSLGEACGKPFAISSLVVVDQGSSNILSL